MAFGDNGKPCVKVCCGPRCGQETGHRALYTTAEAVCCLPVRPSGCLGHCRGGVTVALPNGQVCKLQAASDAAKFLTNISLYPDKTSST